MNAEQFEASERVAFEPDSEAWKAWRIHLIGYTPEESPRHYYEGCKVCSIRPKSTDPGEDTLCAVGARLRMAALKDLYRVIPKPRKKNSANDPRAIRLGGAS